MIPLVQGIWPSGEAARPRPARSAFTLVEMMTSIMIFSVVGLGMVGILSIATDLFRSGEAGRAAMDEGTTIMAAIQDDLDRMIPKSAGGVLYCQVDDRVGVNGNCILAFKTTARDRTLINRSGVGGRLMVVYWVYTDADGNIRDELRRAEVPAADSDGDPNTNDEGDKAIAAYNRGSGGSPLAKGCLHFSIWLTSKNKRRAAQDQWEIDDSASAGPERYLRPRSGTPYDTEDRIDGATGLPIVGDVFPEALRLHLVLSGGSRFARTGTLREPIAASDQATVSLTGIRDLAATRGSAMRIGTEWIGIADFRRGRVTIGHGIDGTGRGLWRSTVSEHERGDTVELGSSYSLVHRLSP